MARISIITVTIGRDSLKECCQSVTNQSFSDWHHYVIGDGILPYDYYHENRTTIGFTRSIGAEEPGANMPDGTPNPLLRWALKNLDLGEYFCFLDDDNSYKPEFLEKMLKTLEDNPEVGIALCGAEDLRYQQDLAGFPEKCRCDNSAFLCRRALGKTIEFPRAHKNREVLQDCEFIIKCSKKGGWINVPEKLMLFGSAPNVPPFRGGIKLLESWQEPLNGLKYKKEGNFEKAISVFSKACADDSADAWSFWHLGESYFLSAQPEKGKKAWQTWLKLAEQTFPITHHWIMYCYALAQLVEGNRELTHYYLEQALVQVDNYLLEDFNYWDNRFNKALFLLLLEKEKESFQLYSELKKEGPEPEQLSEALLKLILLEKTGVAANTDSFIKLLERS